MDNCKKGLGYNAVPPPYTSFFMPSKPDLSYIGLEEFTREAVVETLNAKTSEDVPKVVKIVKPSVAKVEFVKPKQQSQNARKTDENGERPRKSTNSKRGNQRNWNYMMSQRLGKVNTVRNKHVKTARSKAVVNTARPKAILNAVKGNEGNRQQDLQEKDVINSGCSRHITGNMSCLTDYDEIDGRYVAFGGNPKREKITSKGTIKTGELDFKNVYFVKELKFNLFSVSQMCDKKSSVLFNDTECVVLYPEFKLTDKNHVLVRVPRKNNMYIPTRGQ
nr:ribonuclease H-like domain-containing protein [Tanacetum cinerariifolium]